MSVVIAIVFFICAKVAGGAIVIAVMPAAGNTKENSIISLNSVIDKQRRAKPPIKNQNKEDVSDNLKKKRNLFFFGHVIFLVYPF